MSTNDKIEQGTSDVAKENKRKKESLFFVSMDELEKGHAVAKRFLESYYGITACKSVSVINDCQSYIDLLSKIYRKNKKNKLNSIFRGISKEEQKYCGISRLNITKPLDINDEVQYIRKFEENAMNDLSNYTLPLDLVAAAQHYTVKTRFIDWSRSPLVATLFAMHNDLKGAMYYMLLTTQINEHVSVKNLPVSNDSRSLATNIVAARYVLYTQMLHELERVYNKRDKYEYQKYFEKIFMQTNTMTVFDDRYYELSVEKNVESMAKRMLRNKALFLETNFSNTRIASQKGLFQIVLDTKKEYMNEMFKQFDVILIRKSAREKILQYCEYLGDNYYELTPDAESMAREINRTLTDKYEKKDSEEERQRAKLQAKQQNTVKTN